MISADASSEFTGAWLNVAMAVLIAVGAGFGIFFGFRKTPAVKLEDNPAIEVRKASKRYNHEWTEGRFEEVTRRLDAHDEEIMEIQKARAHSLEKINGKFERVLIGLTRIAAKVGTTVPPPSLEEEI